MCDYKNISVVIVDEIGLLSDIYHHTDFAFIGGGLHHKVHNVLEPFVHKIPYGVKRRRTQKAACELENIEKHSFHFFRFFVDCAAYRKFHWNHR